MKIKYLIIIIALLLPLQLLCQNNKDNNKDDKDKNKPTILAPNQIYKPVGVQHVDEDSDKDLAFQYYNSQDFEKAAVYFQKLYDKQATSYYYRYLYYSLIGSAKYDDALALVKKARRNDKVKGPYEVDEGYIYTMQGDTKKGYKLFDNAISDLDADENSIQRLANAFLSIREKKYAAKTYLKGREILKKPIAFGMELGYVYYSDGDYQKMAKEYINCVQYSPKQLPSVYSLFQNYMSNDPDGLVSEAIKNELLEHSQKETQTTFFTEMMLWYSIQIKDFNMAFKQIKAIDKINNKGGEDILDFANTCFQNDDINTAEEAYKYLISTYKKNNPSVANLAKIGLVDMEYELLMSNENITNDQLSEIDAKYTSLLKETDISIEMLPTIINSANLKAFYLHDYEGAINMLLPLLAANNNRSTDIAKIKLALGDIYLTAGDPWEAILYYSQVEKLMKDEPLGHEAKYRNALVSYYIGEFNWAEAKLDVLKASTEKLIANDAMKLSLFIKENKDDDSVSLALKYFAKADLAVFNKRNDVAMQYLDSTLSVNAWTTVEDEVLLKKAKIYIDKRQYDVADSLLAIIGEKYHDEIIADESLFTRALINEKYLNNKEMAMKLYEQVIIDYPESIFSVSARDRYRELRGDSNTKLVSPDDDIIYAPLLTN